MTPQPAPVPIKVAVSAGANIARRDFWKYFLGNALSWLREAQGIPQQSVEELRLLPDGILAEMVPTWREGLPLEVRPEGLYSRPTDGTVPAKVYDFTDHERSIVDQFACGRNLQTIADHFAASRGIPSREAFQITRRLFVALCEHGWCHPSASHCA